MLIQYKTYNVLTCPNVNRFQSQQCSCFAYTIRHATHWNGKMPSSIYYCQYSGWCKSFSRLQTCVRIMIHLHYVVWHRLCNTHYNFIFAGFKIMFCVVFKIYSDGDENHSAVASNTNRDHRASCSSNFVDCNKIIW